MNISTGQSKKRKISPKPIISGITESNEYNEHEVENIIEAKDDTDKVDLNFDGDELIERLDILMNKAESDLLRSNYLLEKTEGYHNLCAKTLKHLRICRRSFVKVIKYSYQMSICNKDYEIDYASAIGDALSIDFTDVTAANTTAADADALRVTSTAATKISLD